MANQLSSIQHIVVLMLENRSFDHMLGFLYSASGNVSPSGQPFEGLTGKESNPGTSGSPVTVYSIKPTDSNAYFMPGADPGEGYSATNSQLFNSTTAPNPPVATNNGFISDFSYTLGWEAQGGLVHSVGHRGQRHHGNFYSYHAADSLRFGNRIRRLRLLVLFGAHRNLAKPRVRQRRNVAGPLD